MMRTYQNQDIHKLVHSRTLGQRTVVKKLLAMRDLAEAEQRAASEAPMIPDDGQNADLREIELALQDVGYKPA
ncbi:hypothetical protein [Rhizobium alvei]|uniref:Uncharacterized protein n=1 Tax=Rhizobium alvei TaxID=1132659 RepID=A0ABT8YNE8_9HYPH|nr:hypothetical protein [Rhizobium alvei]MDO6965208.1 hypothetical protein [Rhizobium alvei]